MLKTEEVEQAVRMNKFESCNPYEVHEPLPADVHGVNVFAVPELKGRRRMITEPLLNAVTNKQTLPKLAYPDRLARRQMLKHCKYMFQLDFEAYYDAIPLPAELRNLFVFKGKDKKFYRLCTLPTGARWSVCVAQAITSVIVDVDTPVVITTMIDNIMIAAKEGQEQEFISAVRRITSRIEEANLLTSPNRDVILVMSDDQLLTEAQKNNTFLGEEYMWNGHERLVRNSTKTVAKLDLAIEATIFTNRSFVSLISLIMYAMHTTSYNAARTFRLMRAYRAIYRKVSEGQDWDAPVEFISTTVYAELKSHVSLLFENKWNGIPLIRHPSYNDGDYDQIIFTDASIAGWGAIVHNNNNNSTSTYQQRWISRLENWYEPLKESTNEHIWSLFKDNKEQNYYDSRENKEYAWFKAKFSAHAEPRAIQRLLYHLNLHNLHLGSKIAIVTDHKAIVYAQKKLNGYGGIGRGYTLNKLFEYVNDLYITKRVEVTFFYVAGKLNPADHLSRNFGGSNNDANVIVQPANDIGLLPLKMTYCPLCERTVK